MWKRQDGRRTRTTLAQLLKRPEVGIERLAPLLRRLMPAFFERVDSGQGIVDSKRSVPLTNSDTVILSGVTEGNAVEGPLSHEEDRPSQRHRVEGPASLSTSHYPLSPAFRLPAEIRNELKSVETEIKYAGYLDQQSKAIERLKRSEERLIPDWFDYAKVSGLSREMNEKLGAGASPHPRTGQSHSWGDPRRGVADQRVYRDPGAPASDSRSVNDGVMHVR